MAPRRNKTRKVREKCCPATTRAIHRWYDQMFEHLGWMILAKSKGYNDKVSTYKNSLNRLRQAIEMKLGQVHDLDKKDDLQILHNNVMILMDHVKRDFH
jgi:hypothetical protein